MHNDMDFFFNILFWYTRVMIHKIIDLFVKEFLTPLHVATEKSHYDVMELLLKHGAKVNALGKHRKKGPPTKRRRKK